MSSKEGVNRWKSSTTMTSARDGTKAPDATTQGIGRMALWFECQQPAKEEYWRRVLADPETYGDLLGEARRIMQHHDLLLQRARERYEFLLSLSPKEGL